MEETRARWVDFRQCGVDRAAALGGRSGEIRRDSALDRSKVMGHLKEIG
jgi:hypothetical protein